MSGAGDDRAASQVDMTAALRTAIQQAGPGWAAQPSRLRLCLNEELGAGSPAFRAQVHQLVVAAEERVPSRLANAPSEGAPLQELARDLASTRGWNMDASTWAVTTWATAMGVVEATELGGSAPVGSGPTVLPDLVPVDQGSHAPGPTVLPASPASTGPTGPTVLPAQAHTPSVQPLGPPAARAELSELSRSGTKGPTRRASALLGHDVDIAFAVRTGPGPMVSLSLLVVGLIALFLGGLFGSLVWFACATAILVLTFMSPYRVLALAGEQAWLMTTRNPLSSKPTAVVHHGWRSEIRPVGGWVLPVVSFGGQRLRFFIPNTGAARLLTRGVPTAGASLPVPQGGERS